MPRARAPRLVAVERLTVDCAAPGPPAMAQDWLAEEEPLEVRLDGDSFMTTLRTPGADRELACGYLAAEGIVKTREDLLKITHCGDMRDPGYGNVIDVALAPHVTLPEEVRESLRRTQWVSSACGMCGHESIAKLRQRCPRIENERALPAVSIPAALQELSTRQPCFLRTGGTHAAALCRADGAVLFSFEDVGRHNATDKVIGARLLAGRPSEQTAMLLVSGRCSFEIVQKAAMAEIPVVVAVSAPTTLAVSTAQEVGITLVAFARGQSFNTYTHPRRIDTGRP